jgi:hypothetical protein
MEQSKSGIIGHEVNFSGAERVYNDHILIYAPGELAGKVADFKTVAV